MTSQESFREYIWESFSEPSQEWRAAKPYLLNPASSESLPADAGEHPEKGIKDVTAKITESC